MRFLQTIGILVALLAGVFLIGGQFLPAELEITREGPVCHSQTRVYEALDTPAQIAKWSTFSREAKLPVEHSETGGPGGWVRWTGDEGEAIEWRIIGGRPPRAIQYEINLDDSFVVTAAGNVEAAGDGKASLGLSLHLQPNSIPGRWGMMMIWWLPSNESFEDLLETEIDNLRSYLAETAGACEGSPAGTDATPAGG